MLMQTDLDEIQLTTWPTFITAHAAVIECIEGDLAAARQLPLRSYDVIIELVEAADGRLRMRDLARSVVLSRSGLTRLVDRLEAEGLLRREACATDRRGAYALLTTAGRTALRDAWPVYSRGIRAHFVSDLTSEEMETITRALDRMLARARGETK